MKRVLVTGGSGFIGRVVCQELLACDYKVRVALFAESDRDLMGNQLNQHCEYAVVGDIGLNPIWDYALRDVDAIIHLAARVHVRCDTVDDPLTLYRKINRDGTRYLAEESVKHGVSRFIFVSSIHVNGTETFDQPFREINQPNPKSPYAISKLEAEQILSEISKNTGLDVVTVRSPLVYGPGVKANFFDLLKLANKGVPMPIKSIKNKRSFISVDNLANFLVHVACHPDAVNELFLVSDDEDVSISKLMSMLYEFNGMSSRQFSFPPRFLLSLGSMLGKRELVNRLCESLQVDCSKAQRVLGWKPIYPLRDGLKKVVDWYEKDGC